MLKSLNARASFKQMHVSSIDKRAVLVPSARADVLGTNRLIFVDSSKNAFGVLCPDQNTLNWTQRI